jgi:hypothetical protein
MAGTEDGPFSLQWSKDNVPMASYPMIMKGRRNWLCMNNLWRMKVCARVAAQKLVPENMQWLPAPHMASPTTSQKLHMPRTWGPGPLQAAKQDRGPAWLRVGTVAELQSGCREPTATLLWAPHPHGMPWSMGMHIFVPPFRIATGLFPAVQSLMSLSRTEP